MLYFEKNKLTIRKPMSYQFLEFTGTFCFQKSPSVSLVKNPTITISIIAWLNSPILDWWTCDAFTLTFTPLLGATPKSYTKPPRILKKTSTPYIRKNTTTMRRRTAYPPLKMLCNVFLLLKKFADKIWKNRQVLVLFNASYEKDIELTSAPKRLYGSRLNARKPRKLFDKNCRSQRISRRWKVYERLRYRYIVLTLNFIQILPRPKSKQPVTHTSWAMDNMQTLDSKPTRAVPIRVEWNMQLWAEMLGTRRNREISVWWFYMLWGRKDFWVAYTRQSSKLVAERAR